ncbi:MAG: chorismate-binding protein, partial [Candidatus Omnitrophota bacterium]|nr:chorismate-binding protein [Candidatus Omnitrophota bacterium]
MTQSIPVIEEMSGYPDSLALFAPIKDAPYSFFLDSASNGDRLARYSFLGCEPFLVFKTKHSLVRLEWSDGRREEFVSDPFIALKNILERYSVRNDTGIPFVSGGVGYFSYDLKDFIEKLPDHAGDDLGLPDCILGFYDTVIVYDNMKKKAYISSLAKEKIKYFKDKISNGRPGIKNDPLPRPPVLRSNFSKESYINAIKKAKEYIRRGDIYQVNLSQRFETELTSDTFELYCRLREISPAPFAAYLGFGDATILSSSPERFLMKRGDY